MCAETKPPTSDEWTYLGFPAPRLTYLEADVLFTEIVSLIGRESRVLPCKLDPGEPPGMKGYLRPVFEVEVTARTCDLFANGRDGYRGRYWQGRSRGEAANRRLLEALEPHLLEAAKGQNLSMRSHQIERSLRALSAKIWIGNERNLLARACDPGSPVLSVKRWEDHAAHGGPWSDKVIYGRRAPFGDKLEIKGAFLSADGSEKIPAAKVVRSEQLYWAGYS